MCRRLPWSYAIVPCAWLVLLLPGSSPAAAGTTVSPPTAGPPDVTLQRIHMIETRSGSRLWEVRADRAEVHEREGYTILSRVQRPVEVRLYSSQDTLTCTASRATVDLHTKDIRLEGEVVARSAQGTELKTEALNWIAASRRLQTDQPVMVSRGGLVSRGRGLEAETGLERVRIFQNITSQVRPAAAAPVPAGRTGTP